jgi:hypothetical protein
MGRWRALRAALAALAGLVALAGRPGVAATPGPGNAEPVHVHLTEPGDTLIGLGRRFLDNPAAWPELARLNQVRDPRRMPVGRPLQIPLRLMRGEPAPATVTAFTGPVTAAGQAAAVGQLVGEGQLLQTGPEGHVSLRLVDGTVLRLRSAAQLRIDESRRVPATDAARSAVQLGRGRVEIEAQPPRAGQPGFRIGTPQGVLGVRGTEFRVDSDGERTRAEVLSGVVGVVGGIGVGGAGRAGGQGVVSAAAAGEQRVRAGHGTVIDAQGRVAAPVTLLPAPDLGGLPALHERPLVRLQLAPLQGAQGYRVQVARDERYDEVLADVVSTTSELRIAGLPDGRHPMRARAIGVDGLEGRDSHAWLHLKARPEPPLPRTPASRAVVSGARVDFAWTASSEAQRYRLQVARAAAAPGDTPAFPLPLHDIRDLQAQAHSLDGLPPGAYLWRLASVRADGDQGPFGDAQAFELQPPPPRPPPPAPPSAPAVGDGSVRIFWQGQPGQRFDFQLARDATFEQIVEQRQLDRAEVELPLPGPGRFHVRLRVLEADGFVGPWSAGQHFDVTPCVRDGRQACIRVEGGTLQLQ